MRSNDDAGFSDFLQLFTKRQLEVTMRTPGASQVIKKLVHEYPSATIGAGTVLTWQDAERAKEAGATFLMSTIIDKAFFKPHIEEALERKLRHLASALQAIAQDQRRLQAIKHQRWSLDLEEKRINRQRVGRHHHSRKKSSAEVVIP